MSLEFSFHSASSFVFSVLSKCNTTYWDKLAERMTTIDVSVPSETAPTPGPCLADGLPVKEAIIRLTPELHIYRIFVNEIKQCGSMWSLSNLIITSLDKIWGLSVSCDILFIKHVAIDGR